MPLSFDADTVTVRDTCTVEDAMPLLEFLQSHSDARVDLRPCTNLHTAALQVLMAARPRIAALPEAAFLARWLAPVLASPANDAG